MTNQEIWNECWSTAIEILHLTPEQFFALTPRQYHLLLDRHLERERHIEWMAGLVMSTVANWSMGAPKEPLQPRDFPLLLLQDGKTQRKRVNRRKIADQIRYQFNRVLNVQNG